MTKTSNIIMALAAIALMGGCTQEDDQQNAGLTEIRLTTSINQTRATTTQDVQIADDEQVYVWAFKQAASGAAEFATPYIKAWQLEADGAGGLSSVNTTHYYYPTEKLTFVGIHGNFSETLTESSTAMPTTVTHTVESNQNSAANYAKSDLLRWEAYDKATSSSAITAQFSHQLTKIVVVLNSSEYSASELNAATITINGIKRQITLNPQTAALGSASGSATAITPYHTANIHHEAIVPPQDKPDGLITITMNGWSITLTPSLPASAFAANTKYTYTLDVKKQQVTMTESITQWNDYTAGGSDPVTITDEQGIAPRNVKMNPLWYVAEYNMTNEMNSNYYTMGITSQNTYYYGWTDAMSLYASGATAEYYNGYKHILGQEGTWHLPVLKEWCSIIPIIYTSASTTNAIFPAPSFNGFVSSSNTTAYKTNYNDCIFGYDDTTKENISESAYYVYVSDTEIHAIRFLGTDYCSAWKYVSSGGFTSSDPGMVTIYSTLIGKIENSESAASDFYTNKWSSVVFGNYESEGAVMRELYTTGVRYTSPYTSSEAHTGDNGRYWSATSYDEEKAYDLNLNTGTYLVTAVKASGRSVRLFRDNPEQDVWKNPLWYVAEYNVANSAGNQFGGVNNSGYFYNWANAVSLFTTGTAGYGAYKKGNKSMIDVNSNSVAGTWHLPVEAEWWSVFPSSSNATSIWEYATSSNPSSFKKDYITPVWGYNFDTKTGISETSYWIYVSEQEIHAIRFLGTPYCSAWKYVISGASTQANPIYHTISATLIDPIADDGSGLAASIWYKNNWSNVTFGNDVSKGAVERVIHARGNATGTTGTAATYPYSGIYYWSATENSSNSSNAIHMFGGRCTRNDLSKSYGFSVRLFLDN